MLYHLGCGERRLDGYVNVDIRQTPATDLVADLNTLSLPQPAAGIFSHAFFEHLRRDSRVAHLRAARLALEPGGFVCYLGLPDFQRVAELYLSAGPGIIGPTFDLHNVYRYTHGDPEQADGDDGWVGQLHKALFDAREVETLLRDAGYPSYVVFRYVFPGEPPETDLSLGFYATGERASTDDLKARCRTFLDPFDGQFLDLATLQFVGEVSRPAPLARAAGVPQRALVQRVARVVAHRLSRL
jgi:predicted SAM-dependent methyltransferase